MGGAEGVGVDRASNTTQYRTMTFTHVLNSMLKLKVDMDFSSGDDSDQNEEQHVFGVINGVLVRKYPMTVNT